MTKRNLHLRDLSALREDLIDCAYVCDASMFDVFNSTLIEAGKADARNEAKNEVFVYGRIVDDTLQAIYAMHGIPSISGSVFRRELSAIEGDAVIRINSPGGSVMEAASMRQALQERQSAGRSDLAVIDGSAASAASLLAMTASRVTMADIGLIYVHEPVMHVEGGYYAAELRELADDLDRMAPRLAAVYDERGVDYGKLGFSDAAALMRGRNGNGTSVSSKEALDSNMIDAIGAERPAEPRSSSNDAARRKTAANVRVRNRMRTWLANQEGETL